MSIGTSLDTEAGVSARGAVDTVALLESEVKNPTIAEVISVATFTVALITAWLYVAGWSYAYHYLDRFRIPLLLVDLPKEQLFVYGGLIAWKNPLVSLGLGTAFIALAWSCVRWRQHFGFFGICVLIVMVIAALFVLARVGSTSTARADFRTQQASDYRAYPRLLLTLKKDAIEAVGTTLADIASAGCGRLLLVSGGRLFIIRPIQDAPGAELDTFVVPLDRLEAFRIRADYASCP